MTMTSTTTLLGRTSKRLHFVALMTLIYGVVIITTGYIICSGKGVQRVIEEIGANLKAAISEVWHEWFGFAAQRERVHEPTEQVIF